MVKREENGNNCEESIVIQIVKMLLFKRIRKDEDFFFS